MVHEHWLRGRAVRTCFEVQESMYSADYKLYDASVPVLSRCISQLPAKQQQHHMGYGVLCYPRLNCSILILAGLSAEEPVVTSFQKLNVNGYTSFAQ